MLQKSYQNNFAHIENSHYIFNTMAVFIFNFILLYLSEDSS